jgi:hypothetical protein
MLSNSTNPGLPTDDRRYIPGAPRRTAEVHEKVVEAPQPDDMTPLLVLAQRPSEPPRFPSLSWLSHQFGLDLYGTTTLSGAARIHMNAAAVVLMVVFAFDVVTWCLLFYFIVSAGSLDEMHFGRLSVSLLGILPALIIFIYERSILTADLSRGWGQRAPAMLGRTLLIGAAAWATAQPVELIAFGRTIDRRIHEEQVREAVVARYTDLSDQLQVRGPVHLRAAAGKQAESRIESLNSDRKSLGDKAYLEQLEANALTLKLTEAEQQRATLKKIWDNARSGLGIAQRQHDAAPTADSEAQLREAQQKATAAEGRFDAATNHRRTISAKMNEQKKKADLTREQERRATEEYQQERNTVVTGAAAEQAQNDVQALQAWVTELRALQPGETYHALGSTSQLRFRDYTFLEKLRVIDDIRVAQPPRWPPVSAEMRRVLEKEYGLFDHTDPAVRQADARNATRTYWAIFAVAMIVPFMSLLFKLTMPEDLALYYSRNWQARCGHPWAMMGSRQ